MLDFLRQLENGLVGLGEPARHIHDQQNQFTAIQRFADFRHHLPSQRSIGPVNAWSIDKDDLPARLGFLFASGTFRIPRMRLRVVCGLGLMMAIFSPTRALSRVDLPAFGRPRIQTNPE